MNARVIACLLLALVYGGFRAAQHLPVVVPAVVPQVTPVPFEQIGTLSRQLNEDDKAALRLAYKTLSRSIAADPDVDPVFPDTAAIRRSHRAALLFVWKGVLDNKTGEVAGLREALEGAVVSRIGDADIPTNPTLKADAAKAFADIEKSIR